MIDDKNNDAVTVAPKIHKVIFENDKIRVLKVIVKPSDKAKMHWHPESINYVLSSGKLIFRKPDGTEKEVELKKGQITSSPEGSHAVENNGKSKVQTVQVEIKT